MTSVHTMEDFKDDPSEEYVQDIIKVVGEEQVEEMTYAGFALKEIIYTDQVMFLDETTRIDDNNYNGQYGSRQNTVTKPVTLRLPRFVMVLKGATALSNKIDELKAEQVHLADSRKEVLDLKKSLEKCEKQRLELEEVKKRLDGRVTDQIQERQTIQDSKRKLEVDIGKIRKAIGERQMKEILEAP